MFDFPFLPDSCFVLFTCHEHSCRPSLWVPAWGTPAWWSRSPASTWPRTPWERTGSRSGASLSCRCSHILQSRLVWAWRYGHSTLLAPEADQVTWILKVRSQVRDMTQVAHFHPKKCGFQGFQTKTRADSQACAEEFCLMYFKILNMIDQWFSRKNQIGQYAGKNLKCTS